MSVGLPPGSSQQGHPLFCFVNGKRDDGNRGDYKRTQQQFYRRRIKNVTAGITWPYMGSCQNHGPFLGTLNSRCRIILRTQKGTIILTTTHMLPYGHEEELDPKP